MRAIKGGDLDTSVRSGLVAQDANRTAMPFSIFERYIFRRMASIFIVATMSTLAIAWTTQVLQRINLVTTTGQSAARFFELATMILPIVIPEVLPFAVVIAVAQTLTTMNTDSELVVINAAGAPRAVTARPTIILALSVCVLSFTVQNVVAPFANYRMRWLLAEASADLLTSVMTEGAFRRIDDNLYLLIGERRADGKMGSVFVADSRQEGTDLQYYAKTAVVTRGEKGSFLIMEDGEVHRRKPGEDVSIIDFASYAFDLSKFSAAPSGEIDLMPKDRSLLYLFNPDPDDRYYKAQPQLFAAEIHRLLSTWLYPLAFALLGLAIAGDARSHREARINPMVSAITLSLLVRWVGYFAFNKVATIPAFAILLYAAPIGASILAFAFFATSRSIELPVGLLEKAGDRLSRIRERLEFLRFRLSGPGDNSGSGAT